MGNAFEIKENNDKTYDFHLRFVTDEEDELACISDAMDRCKF